MNQEENTNLGGFQSYKEAKLRLADHLRIIRRELEVLGRGEAEHACQELMTRLADDRFTLAVLGQFKRGKSSLMNAITGQNILPTGVLPLTSVITILKFGPDPKLIIHKAGSHFDMEEPVESVAAYVTEKENPSNVKNISSVEIEMPEPFLRYGVEFVDTPGVGSAIEENTETTYSFLPKCDAAVFVTGTDTPMTKTELSFLKRVQGYLRKVFFVINKTDLVNIEERLQIEEFVSKVINEQTGISVFRIFSVSSKWAIEAEGSGNKKLFQDSGIEALKAALSSFLAYDKADSFLMSVVQKACRIIEEEQPLLTEHYISDRKAKIEMSNGAAGGRDPVAAYKSLLKQEELLKRFLNRTPEPEPEPEPDRTPIRNTEMDISELRTGDEQIGSEQDITSDLQKRDCPVCHHLAEESFHFFAKWQYQIVADLPAQSAFSKELGFCSLHSWQLLSVCSPYGASVGFAGLSEEIARRLRTARMQEDKEKGILHLLHTKDNCPVCQMLKTQEAQYIEEFSRSLTVKENRDAFSHSQSLCLRHLAALIARLEDPATIDFLLSTTIDLFERDAEDMRSFALKNEALRRWTQNRDEQDAYRRMLIRLVGDKRVILPWSEDGEII